MSMNGNERRAWAAAAILALGGAAWLGPERAIVRDTDGPAASHGLTLRFPVNPAIASAKKPARRVSEGYFLASPLQVNPTITAAKHSARRVSEGYFPWQGKLLRNDDGGQGFGSRTQRQNPQATRHAEHGGRPRSLDGEFLIYLRDGTVLRASIADPRFPWKQVAEDGSVHDSVLESSGLHALYLAAAPSSERAAEIARWIAALDATDYHRRVQAEEELAAIGSPFVELIERAIESGSPEVRYRLQRVLKRLKAKDAKQIGAEFDELQRSGKPEFERGDLGRWSLSADYFGRRLAFDRDQVRALIRTGGEAPAVAERPLARAHGQPADAFYTPQQSHVDFDRGRLNETFLRHEVIDRAFAERGLLLAAECSDPAHVVSSGFRIDRGRSKANSAATMVTRTEKKYGGVIRFEFCLPRHPEIPATVHQVGCYVSVVTEPREIVLIAYDRDDRVVGVCEAVEKTSFLGIESPIPIAYCRCQSNLDLRLPTTEIDQDFAIDDVVFDTPRADAEALIGGRTTVTLHDGSRLPCEELAWNDEQLKARVAALGEEPVALTPEDVWIVAFADRGSSHLPDPALLGVLPDGSILPLTVAAGQMRSRDFPHWTIARGDLTGVVGSSRTLRFPLSEDFGDGRPVAVLPTERWRVADVEIGPTQLSWPAETAELREPFHLESSTHGPDPTHQFALQDAPPVWFAAPPFPAEELGSVSTIWGTRYVLGGEGGIALVAWGAQGVTLAHGDETVDLPLAAIRCLKLPRSAGDSAVAR